MTMLPLVLLVLLVPISTSGEKKVTDVKTSNEVSKVDEYLTRSFDWIGERFLGILDSFVPSERSGRANSVEGRRRKKLKLNKYVFPLIVGFLLIKSVILPLTLKALAILSGKAVVLSLMSLILAAIIGLRSISNGGIVPAQSKIDLVNVPLTKYRRKDVLDHAVDQFDDDPYRYYGERRRRRR
ncbi:hypothetical protein TSAR_011537 [Trichomalopsis sarcophagae]|uniref:Uncharacterized protein n=1 Tax=Trichomalopsis sarcophagae TaxID=543379 RepID=A0A232FIX8_9HYME|nr:hypothetical protein TSAR_011537 [Trichomalopsis sarcophagae]